MWGGWRWFPIAPNLFRGFFTREEIPHPTRGWTTANLYSWGQVWDSSDIDKKFLPKVMVLLLMVQKSGKKQLILVKYPIGYRVVFYISQVVVWDFFHQQYYYTKTILYVLYIFTNYQELQSNTETCTPLKTSIEPENDPSEKENHMPTISFWISLWGCVHVSSKNLQTCTPKNLTWHCTPSLLRF